MIGITEAGWVSAAQPQSRTRGTVQSSFAAEFERARCSPSGLDGIFARAASTYGVPQSLLKAIGYHESRYQADAVSWAGAMGVMQLMPATAKAMGVQNAFDPEQNVMGGAKLLGQLFEQYDGDLKLTLAAYAAGSGSVEKYGGVPPFAETQGFVRDIMGALNGDMPAMESTSGEDSRFYAQVRDFTDFTQEDYSLLLRLWVDMVRYGDAESREESLYPYFYLG